MFTGENSILVSLNPNILLYRDTYVSRRDWMDHVCMHREQLSNKVENDREEEEILSRNFKLIAKYYRFHI